MDQLGIEFLLKGNSSPLLKEAERAIERVRQMVQSKPLDFFSGKDDAEKRAKRDLAARKAVYAEETRWVNRMLAEQKRAQDTHLQNAQKSLQNAINARIAARQKDTRDEIESWNKKAGLIDNYYKKLSARRHVQETLGPGSEFAARREGERIENARVEGAVNAWRKGRERIRQEMARAHLQQHGLGLPTGPYGPPLPPGMQSARARDAEDARQRSRRGAATGRLNNNIFQAQQLIEDFSYAGFRGASNNAAFLLSQLTGTAGLAAMAGLTAVNLGVMAYQAGLFGGSSETAAEKAQKLADALNAISEARSRIDLSVRVGEFETSRDFERLLSGRDDSKKTAGVFAGLKGKEKNKLIAAGSSAIRNADPDTLDRLSRYMSGGVDVDTKFKERASKQKDAIDADAKLMQLEKIANLDAEIAATERGISFMRSSPVLDMGEIREATRMLNQLKANRGSEDLRYRTMLSPEERTRLPRGFDVSAEMSRARKGKEDADMNLDSIDAEIRKTREVIRAKAEGLFKDVFLKAEGGDKGAQAELTDLLEKHPETAKLLKELTERQEEYTNAVEKHLDVSRDSISLAKQEANAIENKIEAQQRAAKEAIKDAVSSRGSFTSRGFDIVRSRSRDFMERAGVPEWVIKRREAALFERQGAMLFGQAQVAGASGDTERQVELLKELQSLQMGVASSDDNRFRAEAAFAASIRTQQMIEQAYARQKEAAESSVISLTGNLNSLNGQILRFEETLASADTLKKLDPTTPEAVARMQELNRQIALTLGMLGSTGGKIPLPALPSGVPPTKKASGGHIRGPGSGTSDSIPAMLSDGEYVLKASAVKALGVPFLNSLNGFASGGRVTTRERMESAMDFMGRIQGLRESEMRLSRIHQMGIFKRREQAHKARMKAIRENWYGRTIGTPASRVSLGEEGDFPFSGVSASLPVGSGMGNPTGLRSRKRAMSHSKWGFGKDGAFRLIDGPGDSFSQHRVFPDSASTDGWSTMDEIRRRSRMAAQAGFGGSSMSSMMKIGKSRSRADVPLTLRQKAAFEYQAQLGKQRLLHQRAIQARRNARLARSAGASGAFQTLAGRRARSYFGRRRGFATGGVVSVHAGIAIGGGINALGEGYDLMGFVNNPFYNPNAFYTDPMNQQANNLRRTSMNSAYGGLTDFSGNYAGSYGKFSDGSNRSRYSGGFGGSMYSGGFSPWVRRFATGGYVRPMPMATGGSVSHTNNSMHAGQITIQVGSLPEANRALGGMLSGDYRRANRRG